MIFRVTRFIVKQKQNQYGEFESLSKQGRVA